MKEEMEQDAIQAVEMTKLERDREESEVE